VESNRNRRGIAIGPGSPAPAPPPADKEEDIKRDQTRKYNHLKGTPKALLPGLDGKPILTCWWQVKSASGVWSWGGAVPDITQFSPRIAVTSPFEQRSPRIA
jgi:hypothetical protein